MDGTRNGPGPLTPQVAAATTEDGGAAGADSRGPAAAKARIRERARRKKIEEQARIDELALLVPSALDATSIVRLLSPRAAAPTFEKALTDKVDEERVKNLLTQAHTSF
jgi:hypothetical protein